MKELYLIIDFSKFYATVNSAIISLADFASIMNSINDIEELRIEKNALISGIAKSIGGSFNKNENYFVTKFLMTTARGFRVPGQKPDIKRLKDETVEELSKKIDELNRTIRIVNNCKRFREDKNYVQENLTIKQKEVFLMKILQKLYDKWLYDIEALFIGNGIFEKRDEEFNEIGSDLDDKGLINCSFTSKGFYASLTLDGMKYVEEILEKEITLNTQRNVLKLNSNGANKDLKQLLRKGIDYTLEKLDKLVISDNGVDDLTKIWGRYSRLQSKINDGIITMEEITLEENRISKALINLIENLDQEDLII